jgi:hypothetical protein
MAVLMDDGTIDSSRGLASSLNADLLSISAQPPYSDEDVDKVKDMLNSGAVDVNEVSGHFNVSVASVIQNLTGISPDAYTNDSYTDQSVDAVMKMINSGVASVTDVADYFSADPSIVESYLTDVELYTAEDMANVQQGIAVASADVRNIEADGDYTEAEIQMVAESINNGLLSTAQVAQQFGVNEDEVIANMAVINQDAATATADAAAAAAIAASNAGGGGLTSIDTKGSDIQTGLLGSETALKTGATNAINMLDQINATGRSDLTTQSAAGLAAVEAQKAIAEQAIRSGTTSGINALDTGVAGARGDLRSEYATALENARLQSNVARTDITDSFNRAEGMFNPYQEAGTAALQKQMALSGALGQDAFNAAYQESPQMAFLREQGMRANLAGAGATGGLGGGNVQKELARFGQGLASQGLQQQIANLSGISGQGLNATGSAAGIATNAGSNLANIAQSLGSQQLQTGTNMGGNLADISMAQGQGRMGAYTGQGSNLANLATGLGAQQLNTRTNLGSQLSGYNLNTGLPQASQMSNLGVNLAQGRTQAGRDLSNQYGAAANAMGNIYSNQGNNLAGSINAQAQSLINQVNSGAITEAQAQTAYSTALAQSQQNTGAALAGQAQTGLANPNYAQGIGNALQAGGFTYGMLTNQNQNNNQNNNNWEGYGRFAT